MGLEAIQQFFGIKPKENSASRIQSATSAANIFPKLEFVKKLIAEKGTEKRLLVEFELEFYLRSLVKPGVGEISKVAYGDVVREIAKDAVQMVIDKKMPGYEIIEA